VDILALKSVDNAQIVESLGSRLSVVNDKVDILETRMTGLEKTAEHGRAGIK
jgi:hypothetical protein